MLSPKFIMRFNFTSVKKKLKKKLSGGCHSFFVADETKVKVGRREVFIQVFPTNVTFGISFSYFFLGHHPRQVHLDWRGPEVSSPIEMQTAHWTVLHQQWIGKFVDCVPSTNVLLAYPGLSPVVGNQFFWCVLYQCAMYTPPNFNRLYWLSPSGKEVAGNKNVWS